MDYKEKYNKLVEAVKVLQETNPSDEGIQNWVNDNVPELADSKDEKKELKKVEQKPGNEVKPFDEFERTLADICIGWIGKEMGWEQYIKDNADVLLRIAVEKFNKAFNKQDGTDCHVTRS